MTDTLLRVDDLEDGPGQGASALRTLAALHTAQLQIPRPTPFATGFHPLDHVLHGGMRTGDLLLIGGKPGQGKTIAALQWARHVARFGTAAVYACYEHEQVTLLARLLACELGEAASEAGCDDEFRLEALRDRLREVVTGTVGIREALDSDPLLMIAEERLREYADRLVLLRASGTRTDLAALQQAVQRHGLERTVLFVDYLQKVPVVPEPADEAERVKRVTEGLKELALTSRLAVVAVAAADRGGLTSRRLRLHHLRGSTALAYEADVAIILNDKISVVSRAHLAYNTTRADEFRRDVVFTVEKNRQGASYADLEFSKDFSNYRFDPVGRWVAERLWEENSGEE